MVSSNIYRTSDKPRYFLGHGVVLAYLALFLLLGSFVTRMMLVAENKKRMGGKRDGWVEGKSEQEVQELGDQKPEFLYML